MGCSPSKGTSGAVCTVSKPKTDATGREFSLGVNNSRVESLRDVCIYAYTESYIPP